MKGYQIQFEDLKNEAYFPKGTWRSKDIETFQCPLCKAYIGSYMAHEKILSIFNECENGHKIDWKREMMIFNECGASIEIIS